jgi:hypothetical protein
MFIQKSNLLENTDYDQFAKIISFHKKQKKDKEKNIELLNMFFKHTSLNTPPPSKV